MQFWWLSEVPTMRSIPLVAHVSNTGQCGGDGRSMLGQGPPCCATERGLRDVQKNNFEKVVAAAAAATNMNSSLPVSIVPLTEPVG